MSGPDPFGLDYLGSGVRQKRNRIWIRLDWTILDTESTRKKLDPDQFRLDSLGSGVKQI